MRKLLLKITSGPDHSFSITEEQCAHFYDEFHFHPEFELTLITKGEGTKFIGDNISPFVPGDLMLVGPNLPHVWRSHDSYYEKDGARTSRSIAIHFSKNFLGDAFFSLPEMGKINDLLEKSGRGIQIAEKLKPDIARRMKRMVEQNNVERLFSLLEIFHQISLNEEHILLSTPCFLNAYLPEQTERIREVHRFVVTNFREPIRLEDAANAANMSPTAFCRYFRQRTRKTFSSYLNEVRIGYACRLLQERKLKISQVCYESGFLNLSNFNKQFKAVMGVTPIMYSKALPPG